MGVNPTEIDAVAYGLLANILVPPIASPVKYYLLKRKNVVDYVARVRTRLYG